MRLANAYDKDRGVPPVTRWVDEELLQYLDQCKSPAFSERSRLRLPGEVRQLRGHKHKVMSVVD